MVSERWVEGSDEGRLAEEETCWVRDTEETGDNDTVDGGSATESLRPVLVGVDPGVVRGPFRVRVVGSTTPCLPTSEEKRRRQVDKSPQTEEICSLRSQ